MEYFGDAWNKVRSFQDGSGRRKGENQAQSSWVSGSSTVIRRACQVLKGIVKACVIDMAGGHFACSLGQAVSADLEF